MRIGELKKATGVSARSIRHYEEKGLITSSRQDNNYREFDEKGKRQILPTYLFKSSYEIMFPR